jgi:membrane dipeptidase
MTAKDSSSSTREIFICDAHVDTLSKMLKFGRNRLEEIPGTSQVTLRRLRQSPVGLIVLACFTEKYDRSFSPVLRTLKMIDLAYSIAHDHADWLELVTDSKEFERARRANKMAAVLSLENGIAVEEDISLLRTFHRLGVRLMSLTWNHRNRLGDGVGKPRSRRGLTKFGREVLAEMERLGIIIDVSHLNEQTFWDVIESTSGPVVATHSNAYSVRPYPRNLTDDQIRAIATRKGFIGLNFCGVFLRKSPRATIADVITHVRHIAAIGGPEIVAIGSDFDGISDPPTGLEHIGKTWALLKQLDRVGFSQNEIKKLTHGNFLRVFRSICG